MSRSDTPPGADRQTLGFYDSHAAEYAAYSGAKADQAWLADFAGRLAPGGRVLDFGCGSGWAAAWLVDRGFAVDALDGSARLADEARRRYGIAVWVAEFSEFATERAYDGIWCSFALLHAPRDAIPGHIARLARALVPGGALYLGVKEGAGTARDRLGRRYTYVSEDELTRWCGEAGLTDLELHRERRNGYTGAQEVFLHLYALRSAP